MARSRADKPSAIMRVTPQRTLAPVSAWDEELIERYAVGSDVEVTIHQTKSEKQARLFWSVLGKVLDSTDYPTTEALATALKIRLKHVNTVSLIGGGIHVQPKSIREMGGDEFGNFFDAAMDVLASEVIPGLDIEAVVEECRAKGRVG